MKTNAQNKNMDRKPAQQNKQRPDVRDNLDSRENEENDVKGDDVTHNKKDTKEDKLKSKSKSK